MTFSTDLLAYSDLGLFLAVVGIYVFFAALWLVYSVTEKNARSASETDERIDLLRREAVSEAATENIKAQFEQLFDEHTESLVGQDEFAKIQAELATVREIAVLSGNRVRALKCENDELRSQLDEQAATLLNHVSNAHGVQVAEEAYPAVDQDIEASVDATESLETADHSIPLREQITVEMTRVAIESDVEATVEEIPAEPAPFLRIYNPVVEVPAAESSDTEEDQSSESDKLIPRELSGIEQEVKDAACYEEEKGLVFYKRPTSPDDLTRIWGVGGTNQDLLNENGVFYFGQIANWSEANIDKFNNILCFRGRIEREDWVGQAKRLAAKQMLESYAGKNAA